MSHPGISRLISSFRFRDGAYLVLEYASGESLLLFACSCRSSSCLPAPNLKYLVLEICEQIRIRFQVVIYIPC